MIYGPDGRALCEPLPEDREGILYADLDPVLITLAKATADPTGHYARADAVRLVVNRTKRRVMTEIDHTAASSEASAGSSAGSDDGLLSN